MKPPAIKPTVILCDTAPLVHLAAGDALHVLTDMGPVVLVDVVVLEATYDQDKPYAKVISAWLTAGASPGSNAPVTLAKSDLGPLYRMALEEGRRKPRHAGEIAIMEWLSDEIGHIGGPALVVYENGAVPGMVARQGLAAEVVVATTRSLLQIAEERGIIADAEAIWATIIKAVPTGNPLPAITFVKPERP